MPPWSGNERTLGAALPTTSWYWKRVKYPPIVHAAPEGSPAATTEDGESFRLRLQLCSCYR